MGIPEAKNNKPEVTLMQFQNSSVPGLPKAAHDF